MRTMMALLCLLAAASANPLLDAIEEEWNTFKVTYNKNYDAHEELYRKEVYAENRYKIEKHNQRHLRGLTGFTLKVNEFSDLTHSEFVKNMNGYKMNETERARALEKTATFIPPAHVKRWPNFVNWTHEGAVTGVKNQWGCAACWAFTATGALEGLHFRKTQRLVSLSEQNLIDCSGQFNNDGCEGGGTENAFQYVAENNGIDTESSYPYQWSLNKCRYNSRDVGATAKGYTSMLSGDEKLLMKAVATVGPIATSMDASLETMQSYSGGIYYDDQCRPECLNHAVLIVGYGTDPVYGKYWLIKNSWGTSWGIDGYMKLARDMNNHCGIATAASFPLV